MSPISRREFLSIGAKLAAMMSLSPVVVADIADALEKISTGAVPVVWLQGQSCSGCSVSLLNSDHPDPAELLTGYISLLFHSTLSAASGHRAMDVVEDTIATGEYLLVVEGSVPTRMPSACVMGGKPIAEILLRAAHRSKAVVAVGTCAAYGGIPAAEDNPTGAVGVPQYLTGKGVSSPIISIPGCPMHPDWLVGTLVHVIQFGIPALDAQRRPKMFFESLVHDQCPRFADYERENFAKAFGEPGCLFKLGCVGPNTHADCSTRMWNTGTNFCIKSGAPCIGCTEETFARHAHFPFFRKNEDLTPQG